MFVGCNIVVVFVLLGLMKHVFLCYAFSDWLIVIAYFLVYLPKIL